MFLYAGIMNEPYIQYRVMMFFKQYRFLKKALKTRAIIWATSIIPYNNKKYGGTGVVTVEDDSDCTETKILQESEAVPVPRDLYDKTAEFMRRDFYDDSLKAITVSNKGSVWQVSEGRVYTNRASQFFVLSRDGKIVPSVSYKSEDAATGRAQEDIQLTARFFPKPVKIQGRVASFVLGGGSSHNISHWMMDGLARVKLLGEFCPLSEVDMFVVQGNKSPNWVDTLTLLGVDESKIRFFDQQLIHIQAKELIAMTHPRGRRSSVTPKWVIEFLREKYLPTIPNKNDGWPEKIYISRKDSSLRGVLNEEELLDYLQLQGYTELILSPLSFAEKVGYFHNAKEIVSMSGAGLGFLAFCQPNTKVIELFPSGFVHYVNCVIAEQVGMDYRYLIFGSTNTDSSGYSAQREELVVDIQRLSIELAN